jgi:hypothetical protein
MPPLRETGIGEKKQNLLIMASVGLGIDSRCWLSWVWKKSWPHGPYVICAEQYI